MTWYNPLTWFTRNDTPDRDQEDLPDNRYRTDNRSIQQFTAYWPGSNGGHNVYAHDYQWEHPNWSIPLYPVEDATITDYGALQGAKIKVQTDYLTVEDVETVARYEREYEEEAYWNSRGLCRWNVVDQGEWERVDD